MAVTSKYSDTEASSLMELFNGSERFLVPQFQRNYAWTKDMASELWSDLVDGFQSIRNVPTETQEGQYLLGPIVLVPDKGNDYSIIDGQQRLSTITMLFCVARDIMLENMDARNLKPEGYDRIMEMIENKNLRGDHLNWKMVLNDTDRNLFEEIQEYENNTAPQIERINKFTSKTKSEKLLVENYKHLYDLMMVAICTNFEADMDTKIIPDEQKRKLIKQNISTLNYFLNHVRKNNFIIKIVVKNSETAYQIFETLNDRSKPLSKSNLIKNYVLSLVKNPSEQRDMSNTWNKIFEDIGQDEGDDVFLLDSLRSRRYDEKLSPKKLYRIIRKYIKTEKQAKNYIKELKNDAEFLTTLYAPSGYPDESIRGTIYAIRQLGAKSIRPPILAAYRKWYDEQKTTYEQLVLALLKFFFNVRIIRKMHAGKLELIMLNIVEKITEGESLQNIITELQKHNNSEDFRHNFNNFISDPRSNEAKYVLQQITIHLGSKHSDVKPLDTLTLEHILPQKTNKWNKRGFFSRSRALDADMNSYINHLGNLTLLNTAVNKKIKNEIFSIKKVEYSNSDLAINKQTVCNYQKWTAEIIEKRAKMFADIAYGLWNLDSL